MVMLKQLVILLLVVCVSAQPPPPPGLKPGRCPVDNTATVCDCRPEYITCNHDILCPGVQKCCSWGCGCRTRCTNPVNVTAPVCRYNGISYTVGQSFPATDGCNWCTCKTTGVSCTKTDCFPYCKYNGRTYRPGERFESFNGCGECICDSTGFVNCLDVLCDDQHPV